MRRPEGHPWVAATIDLIMSPLARLRPRVVGAASGRVLEIGVGTGMNLSHYADIESWCGVEPDPHMARRARARLEKVDFPATLERVGAEALPFEDGSFDTVVATWVFCTIPDVEAAASEIARVMRPGARLVWIEHVGASHAPIQTMQRWVEPVWKHLAGGCHLTRDPVKIFENAGLAVDEVEVVGRPRWNLLPHKRGVARRR